MKICPKCGLEGKDNFCYQCGEAMIEPTEKNESADILSSTFSVINNQTSRFLSSGSANLTSLLNKNKSSTPTNSFNRSQADSQVENSNRTHSSLFNPSSSLTSPASDTKPLSPGEYFKYNILFGIPVIGLISSIMFGFGNTANINLRNFAQAAVYNQVLLFLSILVLMLLR